MGHPSIRVEFNGGTMILHDFGMCSACVQSYASIVNHPQTGSNCSKLFRKVCNIPEFEGFIVGTSKIALACSTCVKPGSLRFKNFPGFSVSV